MKRVECLAACGGALAVQVNGEWLENATPADIDKMLAGELEYRPFAWPKSPGETILFANVWKENSASLDVYKAGGGYAKLEASTCSMKPEEIVEDGQEVQPARPRGRRLPDRDEVELPAQERPEAALPLRERGRERARDLQGPR